MKNEDDRNELDPNVPPSDEDVVGREDESFEGEESEKDLEDPDEYGADDESISEVE